MKNTYLLMLAILSSGVAVAGVIGGGNPPSIADVQAELMNAAEMNAGLFDNGSGDIGLLTRSKLASEVIVQIPGAADAQLTKIPSSITVSEADFEILRQRTEPIEALSVDGESLSYDVSPGEQADSVHLKLKQD